MGEIKSMVSDAMSSVVLTVGPDHSLQHAATKMAERGVGSAVVVDPDGKVGKSCDAKTTPHMIVIGKDGKVAYNGAIDSINSTDAADVEKADNHVAAALDALLAGKTVEVAKTKPYGCGVKYAK